VSELDVTRKSAEQGNAFADEYGHACDDETLDEPGAKKSLDGDPPVHVGIGCHGL